MAIKFDSSDPLGRNRKTKLVPTGEAGEVRRPDDPASTFSAKDEPSKRGDSGSSTYRYRDPEKRRAYVKQKMREHRARQKANNG